MTRNDKKGALFSLSVFCGVFLIYLFTLAPSITGGDAGELITFSYMGGILHPPGYPLYSFLAKFFTYLPHGSIAWRVNLLSALCDAVAAVFIFRTVVCCTTQVWPALLSAGLFAFSPLIWKYAITAEVFALNNLFVSILLYLTVRFLQERKLSTAYGSAFLCGLALTHHQTFIFYVLGFGGFCLWIGRKELIRPKVLAKLIGFFSLGLTPYLLLFLRFKPELLTSWGDISTINGFLNHVFRRDYGTLNLSSPMYQEQGFFLDRVLDYFIDFTSQSLYFGPLLAVYGVFQLFKKKPLYQRDIALATLFAFSFYCISFHALSNSAFHNALHFNIQARFWQQLNIVAFVWIGIGFGIFFQNKKWMPFLAALILMIQVGINYSRVDKSKEWALRDFAKAVLAPLPQNSILITEGDVATNTTLYVKYCENFRPDVRIIPENLLSYRWFNQAIRRSLPDIRLPGIRYKLGSASQLDPLLTEQPLNQDHTYSIAEFIAANINYSPIFIFTGFHQEDTPDIDRFFSVQLHSLASKIIKKNEAAVANSIQIIQTGKSALAQVDAQALSQYPDGEWEHVAFVEYSKVLARFHAAEQPLLNHGSF